MPFEIDSDLSWSVRSLRRSTLRFAALLSPLFALAPSAVFGQGTGQLEPAETAASDQAWEREEATGACTRLHNRLTDSAADVADCHRHDASIPACINYRNFGKAWFDMRKSNDGILQWQTKVIDGLGSRGGSYPLVYNSPEHIASLRRMLAFVQTGDVSRWKSGASFSTEAYSRCMSGRRY